jgi:hypothetical protein
MEAEAGIDQEGLDEALPRALILMLVVAALACLMARPASANAAAAPEQEAAPFPEPAIAWSPEHYICCRTLTPLAIDGRLSEEPWQSADWTADFVDIEGDLKPAPRFRTRAKMLWDDDYFYVAAEMEEPDVWATLTERDAVIFHDNDFEVFIDPDADTHEYYELEVNAFATEWDLLLIKPYRDGGPAVHAWDTQGLKTGVFIDGTLNRPGDRDQGWSVEIAFPWSILKECAHKPAPPEQGDQWRVNFSRVEWRTHVEDGKYVKQHHPGTGKPLPEDNWVWSPQGLINMHYPEMWGIVQFCADEPGRCRMSFVERPADVARWALRQLYYKERTYHRRHGHFTSDITALGLNVERAADLNWPPTIAHTPSLFEASLELDGGKELRINQDGRVWELQ